MRMIDVANLLQKIGTVYRKDPNRKEKDGLGNENNV